MKPHEGLPVGSAGRPLGESHAVMILVHGRNAAPANILEVAALLERPEFTYLAPAAANASATAAPMPRVAPVTSASSPAS